MESPMQLFTRTAMLWLTRIFLLVFNAAGILVSTNFLSTSNVCPQSWRGRPDARHLHDELLTRFRSWLRGDVTRWARLLSYQVTVSQNTHSVHCLKNDAFGKAFRICLTRLSQWQIGGLRLVGLMCFITRVSYQLLMYRDVKFIICIAGMLLSVQLFWKERIHAARSCILTPERSCHTFRLKLGRHFRSCNGVHVCTRLA